VVYVPVSDPLVDVKDGLELFIVIKQFLKGLCKGIGYRFYKGILGL
jgi:hypothetical protein